MTSGFSHTVAQWSGVRLRERKVGKVCDDSILCAVYPAFEHVLNSLVPRPFHLQLF